jgi:hypothetical protein
MTAPEAPSPTVFSVQQRDILDGCLRTIRRRSHALMAALDHEATTRAADSLADSEFLRACADLARELVDATHVLTQLLRQVDAKGRA